MRRILPALLLLLPLPALAASSSAPPPLAVPKFAASSSKTVAKEEWKPALAFDGLLETAWTEGAEGSGQGEWIEVDLGEERKIGVLSIWGGDFSSREAWSSRARVRELKVVTADKAGKIWEKDVEIGDRFARKDVPIGQTVKVIRLLLSEVHEGSIHKELAISELAFDFTEPVDPLWKEAIDKAILKNKGWKEAAAKAGTARDEAFAKCKANDDYRTNFLLLGALAAHGPTYLIEPVGKYVPVGFRLQHLQPDTAAIDQIGKLKDANAVGYLEIAASGTVDDDLKEDLFYAVKRFAAYQDLRRTERKDVPNWGTTGLEVGALAGRGEPVAIEVDSMGNVWVADIGNNRVQRFSSAGTPDKVICTGGKDIVDNWFGDDEDPYASGCKAGDGNGQFEQPVHLTVGNYDIVAVIDAGLRVQTFDIEGTFKNTWKVPADFRPKPGRGNATPILRWLGDDFYVLVKNEVFIYSNIGELKKRYPLEGGDVQSAVIAAGGKLLVRHTGSADIIEYNPADGFRQGKWSKTPVPDDGSEDWDLGTDAKDNVYVVTDAGNIYKFKKNGKMGPTLRAFENGRDMPRIAVNGPIIYVSAKDEITRVEQDE